MKVLLFDVDLTLISTGGAGIRALNRACQKLLKLENAMDGIIPSGKTDPSIVREILAARRVEQRDHDCVSPIIELYLTYLREEVETTSRYQVLPGIMPLLTEMSKRTDVLLGLATGNVEAGARIKLQRGGLNPFFAFGGFGSDSENRAELVTHGAAAARRRCDQPITANDVFVIGDTPRDIEAGREAGFQTVGVATGQYSADALSACEPTLTIANFETGRDQFLRTTCIE